MKKCMIESDRLKVYFRIEDELSHTRFERMGVMEEVELDGTHTFCVDEQVNPKYRTSFGTGLIGEYVWEEVALEAKKGEKFPKLGVGLLTQKKNNRKFYFMEKYECEPYDMTYNISGNRAEFTMEPKECMDIAVRMKKIITVEGNTVTAHMSVENVGTRAVNAFEYQHNFVNIDNIPVSTGYKLEMPFHGETWKFKKCVYKNFKPIKPRFLIYVLRYFMKRELFEGFMEANDSVIEWKKSMEGHTFWASTEKIQPDKGLYWKLSNDNTTATVEEHFSFVPQKVVNWGMEHCVSTEVYAPINVEPGQTYEWERKWIFND